MEGAQQDLVPLLQDEIYRIARELPRNAVRHARAGQIKAEIRYQSRQLRLHVRDDGKGFESAGHAGTSESIRRQFGVAERNWRRIIDLEEKVVS
ncbi:MAG: hypothetical protein SFV54_16360 [Bryobacteraceae bacterium]|nr:hypothetical protein [Bryobacteraceae bacterium]